MTRRERADTGEGPHFSEPAPKKDVPEPHCSDDGQDKLLGDYGPLVGQTGGDRTISICPECDATGWLADVLRHLVHEHRVRIIKATQWAAGVKLRHLGSANTPEEVRVADEFRRQLDGRLDPLRR